MRDGMISLDGNKFRILLDTYRQRDLADFSPRASLPSQSINQSELLLYQPLVMTDWRHGFGFMWMTDAMGYMKSDGGIDTRFGGMIVSAPRRLTIYHRPNAGDNTRPTWAKGMVHYRGYAYTNLWVLYGDGLYKLSPYDLSLQELISGYSSSVYSALCTEEYIFFSPYDRLKKYSLATGTVTDAGVNASSGKYHWMVAHNGYVFAGKMDTNQVYYGSKNDLSDLHGSPDDDPNVIYVGYAGQYTLKATPFGQELLVAKPNGIYTIGQDMVARRVLDFSSEASLDRNFNLFTVYNGMLYFNIKNKIYQWNGAKMMEASIPRFSDTFPYSEVTQVITGQSVGGYLYVLAHWKPESSASYYKSLFAHDGVGWHKLHDFTEYPTSTDYGGDYNKDFIVGIEKVAWNFDENVLVVGITIDSYKMSYYYFKIGTSAIPLKPFAPSGSWYSPRLDMGFRRVTKSAVQLQIEAQRCSASTPVTVNVRLDDSSSWVTLGTITSSGIHRFDFSQINPITKTAEFRYITIRLDFVGTSTDTAIIEGITLRFLMRPDVFYGWNMDIIASSEYTFDGQVFETSPQETLELLKTIRDSKQPIEFIDIHGGSHYGYISSINVQSLELFEPASDATTNVESVINVNFVEAK